MMNKGKSQGSAIFYYCKRVINFKYYIKMKARVG